MRQVHGQVVALLTEPPRHNTATLHASANAPTGTRLSASEADARKSASDNVAVLLSESLMKR